MPRDVSTRWNSTYDMVEFATNYHAALDIMTADRDMNLRQFELSKKEWGMVSELSEVLQVCCRFSLSVNKLIYLNIRFSSTALSSFRVVHPASAPSYQPWTTSMNFWRQSLKISSTLGLSVLPLPLEKKHSTVIMTKPTTLRFIGLPWVSLIFHSSFILQVSSYSSPPSS